MRRSIFYSAVVSVLAISAVRAQQQGVPIPTPTLLTVFPCGAQAGKNVEVTIDGTMLESASELRFSIPGITAELQPPASNGRSGKSIVFRVQVPADAPLGLHDVRVVAKQGITNPRAFAIGDRPEIVEREPNDD